MTQEADTSQQQQPVYDGAVYEHVLYYSIEIRGSHNVGGDKSTVDLETTDLAEAIKLWQNIVVTRPSDADWWVNLVAWAGRSGPLGGPPTGYILMRSHEEDGDE
jgi:hypothetical protein